MPAVRQTGPHRQGWIRRVWQELQEGPQPERELLRLLGQIHGGGDARAEIDQLVAEGWLLRMPQSRVMLERITGELRMNPRGFGFVGTGVRDADVFIPARLLNGAFHGDQVSVWVRKMSAEGPEGQIMDIV